MFRIGEFSKLTQVTIRMLRYYDEMGILKPAQIDPSTEYRMYSVEQIPILNKIIYLRDSGFNVSEIAAALKDANNESIVVQLEKKYAEIERVVETEKEKLKKIEFAKYQLLHQKSDMHYNVLIKSIPSYLVLAIRKIIPDYYAEGELYHELTDFVRNNNIAIENNTFSIYHDAEYKEKNVDVELCVLVKKAGVSIGDFVFRNTEPIPIMGCTMVYGSFSNIAGAYRAFAEWLQKNKHYQMTGKSRQIVHRGPWNEENPQNYLVEIQIPIEKNR